jgi:DNA polymerase I-like protein with 3'-5' exonuclease and polymerase domains
MNKSYVLVDDFDKLKDLVNHIKENDIISFDIETNSLNPRKGKIVGFSISAQVGVGYYMPTMVYRDELVDATIEDRNCHDLAKKIINLLLTKKIIGHNLSFDFRFVKCFYDIDLIPAMHADTLLLVHTVQEEGVGYGSARPFGLKEIAESIQEHIGLDMDKEANEEQLELKASIKANGGSISRDNYEIYKADIDILGKYAAADTDLTLRVYNHFIKILEAEGLEKLFFEDEVMPLYKEVTIPMEQRGVRLDMSLISQAKLDITEDLSVYHSLVLNSLLESEDVKLWIIHKATENYPPNNKGTYAQHLVKKYKLDLPVSEKTGKYSLTIKSISQLPDSKVKDFLITGDVSHLDEHVATKISLDLWKKDNDGRYINIQSKDHIGSIAFQVMGIEPISHTDKGKPQFDDTLIQSISNDYEWVKNLRIYNKLLKIKSTYIDRFLESEEDGKYHFYFKQHATVSGRYGSDAQQLPRPKEEGEEDPVILKYNNIIRAFFIPYEGNIFIDDDYSSLEPRVFAHVSGDDNLKRIFSDNLDFYSHIAIQTEKLEGVSANPKDSNFLKKVQPSKRQSAKAYSLGIAYGMKEYALSKSLNIDIKEAKKLINGYLSGFPQLADWMKRTESFSKNNGYIKTESGRIRHLPKLKYMYDKFGDSLLSWDTQRTLKIKLGDELVTNMVRDFTNSVNNSYNVQIQGLSASIVNRAAININRSFKREGIVGQVVANIHDQLIVEIKEEFADRAKIIVQNCMERTTLLNGVDLIATPSLAKNWRDGH